MAWSTTTEFYPCAVVCEPVCARACVCVCMCVCVHACETLNCGHLTEVNRYIELL